MIRVHRRLNEIDFYVEKGTAKEELHKLIDEFSDGAVIS